ncbi:MAG: hypothetical protein IIT81_02275 [Mycoplasmataceae bacterium]|nr:hypothetical protein [Mycoplasmataceae bacterium]
MISFNKKSSKRFFISLLVILFCLNIWLFNKEVKLSLSFMKIQSQLNEFAKENKGICQILLSYLFFLTKVIFSCSILQNNFNSKLFNLSK